MKNYLILSVILFGFSCSNDNNSKNESNGDKGSNVREKKNPPLEEAGEQQGDGIVGEWQRIAAGDDLNNNGVLDDAENKLNKSSALSASDYFRFSADGKCIYDKDMNFEGQYEIKLIKNIKTIFIYPSGLPAGLTEKEREENAMEFRIHSLESNKLVVKPEHLMGRMVVYKRI